MKVIVKKKKKVLNGGSLCSRLVANFCLTLCDSMDCSPPGSSVHEDSPGKNTGMGCHALLQTFLAQGLNWDLLSPALAGGFFTTSNTWEAHIIVQLILILLSSFYT